MERLTKKMNGKYFVEKETITPCTLTDITFRTVAAGQAIDRLAHYENLAEQGRLIELPCKLGKNLYVIYNKEILQHKIIEFSVSKRRLLITTEYGKTRYRKSKFYFPIDALGIYVFHTKPKAKAKLKELTE